MMDIRFLRTGSGDGQRIRRGEVLKGADPVWAAQMIAGGWAEEISHAPVAGAPPRRAVERAAMVHEGAGWYTLPDGRRVRGRAAAEAALEAL
jgi:hypothetical protein